MRFEVDTIAAIATAAGPAGIGIVRISGPEAFRIADRVTPEASTSASQPPQTLRRLRFLDPVTGEEIDDGLRAVFRSPHSFTGEHIVELQGHGGTLNLTRVFAACLASGARAARPGEFSERAFVNDRLDLAQAEAIAALINAGTVTAQRAARSQLSGFLSREVNEAAASLKAALARMEAVIDFPEDVGELDRPLVMTLLAEARERIARLLATSSYGRRLHEGVTIVLAGRPNVGKSSLLNALSGTDRSIVTAIPGTTRDIVEEALNMGGIPVRALDTAGLRESDDPVESIGIARARRAAGDADIVILVVDATTGITGEDRAILAGMQNQPVIVALNKTDLCGVSPVDSLRAELAPCLSVGVSAVSGAGLAELADAVGQLLGAQPEQSHDTPLVMSARHEDALRRAVLSLDHAQETLLSALPPELIAVDVHGALQALGEITGETAREEIIAGIFAAFCIGK